MRYKRNQYHRNQRGSNKGSAKDALTLLDFARGGRKYKTIKELRLSPDTGDRDIDKAAKDSSKVELNTF